jgi:hypothetical protein
MRQSLGIESGIGIVGKGKGPLIFCGLMLAIGLAWITLVYLDNRQKNYEERVVGALKFLDGAIDTLREFDADLYAPSIKSRPEPNRWVLSGIMVIRGGEAKQSRDRRGPPRFSAILESICLDHADPTCWRLEELVVDGKAVNTSQPVSPNTTSTLEGGPIESATEISGPKEPSTRSPADLAAPQSITAAAPQEDVGVTVQERLPCVEEDAWHDPDIGRNRQLIIDEAICLRVIEFTENDLNWRVQVFDSGRPGNKWVVLHDDENTAFDSAIYAIVRYGGKVVDVDLLPPTRSDAFVDPNQNFARVDAHRQTCGGPARHAAPLFTSTIIQELGAPPYLALHNNYDGHFRSGGNGNISVRHNTRGLLGLPAPDTGERLADEDNFIIVSGLTPPSHLTKRIGQLTDELRNSGVNVIYEYVNADSYDCSLSNFLLLYGGAEPGQYFNIEAEAGDYESQTTMIDVLVGTLDNPLRASR